MSKDRFCIDLFSGAGGLTSGLESAGFRSILANELDPHYADSFAVNFPNSNMVVDDIRAVSEGSVLKNIGLCQGELDLLAGGPPCQGFSINAPIRSLNDERNQLFWEFLRIAQTLLPKAVLIENVPGIISLGKGTVVNEIYKFLANLGYSVSHKILFAGHYGVPQTRFRTIILAYRVRNFQIEFPFVRYNASARANFAGSKELCLDVPPLFAHGLKPHTTVSQAISDLPAIESGNETWKPGYLTGPKNEYQSSLRHNSEVVTNHRCAGLGPINLERLKHIPQGGSWRDIPFDLLPAGLKRARRSDHTKRYGRLHPDGLCSTILTKCDPHWGSFFHPTQDRVISVREAARLQSFPDDFQFTGSLTQQYAQVGNAVPPLMARAIGLKIQEAISEFNGEQKRFG